MPFGLTNVPAGFQHFLNTIFADLLDVFVIIYLNDILILSLNEEDHVKHVSKVLHRLWKHNLFAKGEKCVFHTDSIEYLSHIIGLGGLRMDLGKVKIIQDWPKPKKVKDIQSFLGFANFYRCYIHNYSDIVVPLTHLTWKDTLWDFSDKCCLSFSLLKNAFTMALALTHWRPDLPIIVETDASDYALVAILSIQEANGDIHPIAFHSMTFSAMKLNYDVHNKELLAIFDAFKYGGIILKVLLFLLMLLLTTRILNIFLPLKFCPGVKPVGQNFCPDSTWSSVFALAVLALNLML